MSDTETFPRAELERLMSCLCDSRLTPDEHQRLEKILLGSREARRFYHCYLDMHLHLGERTQIHQAINPQGVISFRGRPKTWPMRAVLMAAAAVILLLGGMLLFRGETTDVSLAEGRPKEPQVAAAVVRASEQAAWRGHDLKFGSELMAEEPYELIRGKVVLRFYGGAELSIRAPAKFKILSDEEVFFEFGQIAARVPPAAAGFTVMSERTAFIDMGTEFSLNFDRKGTADLVVHEGRVVANLLGDNGTTLRSSSAEAGARLRVNTGKGTIRESYVPAEDFLQPIVIEPEFLVVPKKYRQVVRAAKPVGYWTFENAEEPEVPNEVGDRHPARLFGDFTLDHIKGNTAAYFKQTKVPTGMIIDDLFEGLNRGQGYTIELWFNPELRNQATLAALDVPLPADEVARDPQGYNVRYLALIEMLGHSQDYRGMIFRANTLRQNHRSPAGILEGINSLASARYGALRWQHLVAVTKPNEIVLYLNGAVIQRVSHDSPVDDEAFRLILGRLRPPEYGGRERQFKGHLDEIAIYARPMEAAEVNAHWSIIAEASSER